MTRPLTVECHLAWREMSRPCQRAEHRRTSKKPCNNTGGVVAGTESFGVAESAVAMEGGEQGQLPAPKSLQELAVDGQQQLHTVVEAAHDILLSLNRALCSPSFWVAPSLQAGINAAAAAVEGASEAASGGAAGGESGGVKEKGSDGGEGLAALDATRVRYKTATGALRVTVAAIVKQTLAVRAESDGSAAENVDTCEADYLEKRAADLREEVARKNQILKLHIDQLRTLIADIFMWQTAGL